LTSFFRNTVARKDPKAVKIAVIDDGMDSALHIVDGSHAKVFAGNSFCTSLSDSMNAYYVPQGSHGTRVASVICQICPKVDLCIARLDEQNLRGGERVINPLSAARVSPPTRPWHHLDIVFLTTSRGCGEKQAIEWVIECGVDIICMSWTIETSGEDTLEPLKKAIKAAKDKGIIMFCSASDQGGSSRLDCYPGAFSNQDGHHCIRIGSCSSSDLPSIWVNEDQIDFLLPGEKILIKDSDGTSEHQTGSSYATAVAVGLAGLLIYCTMALGSGIPPSSRHRAEDNDDGDDDDGQDAATIGDADSQYNDGNNGEAESDSDESEVNGHVGGAGAAAEENGHAGEASAPPPAAAAASTAPEEFNWDRRLMYNMFRNMAHSATGAAATKLIMPEKYIIETLKKSLKCQQNLGRLKWDATFQTALGNLLKELKVSWSLLTPLLEHPLLALY